MDILSVKVDRKRKVSASIFLRALGVASDEEILSLFEGVDTEETHHYMQATLRSDPAADPRDPTSARKSCDRCGTRLHGCMTKKPNSTWPLLSESPPPRSSFTRASPREPPSLGQFPQPDKQPVLRAPTLRSGSGGRYKFNRRLSLPEGVGPMTLTRRDIISVLRMMIRINKGDGQVDDIDHLGNRRVRAVGELVQNQVRVGLLRMERMVKEKMTLVEQENASPQALVNIRPVVAAVREFFGGSQLRNLWTRPTRWRS